MSEAVIISVPTADIIEGERLRKPTAADIKQISLSMAESGRLINPIKVRPHPTEMGKYQLVAGSTRLAAAQLLGWSSIEAIVDNLSDDQASLEEVDENLYRSDLTPADLTFFMKRRLELFEFRGGKLKRGRDLRKSANLADLNPRDQSLLYKEIEEKFGTKRRTAERLVRRARNIPEKLWPVIKSSKVAIKGTLLDKISELQPEQRTEVERLVSEEKRKIADAIKRVQGPKPPKVMTVSQAFECVRPSWEAWNAKEKASFLQTLKQWG